MTKATPITKESTRPNEERLRQLRDLFPEAFTEGRFDVERLRTALGEDVETGPERFNFTWSGKRDAIRQLQRPSRETLVPAPAESVNFDTSEHIFIEGENLEVLKLLYKPYFGRVKLIYIDPPYNTGNDFIYPDSFADPRAIYLRVTGQTDAEGNLLTSNPESGGRYHSAWLSMMYPRLFLARQLLRDDGAIFVSIDDHEVHNLRQIMNEIFGEENFVASVIWQKIFSPKNTAKHFSEDHDYVMVYARNGIEWRPQLLPRTEEANARYENPDNDPRGPWTSSDLTARNYYGAGQYEVTGPTGKRFKPTVGAYWRIDYDKFLELDRDGQIWWGKDGNNMPRQKRFLTDVKQGIVPQTLWLYEEVGHTQEAKKELLETVHFEETDNVLDTVKPTRLLRRILQLATIPTGSDVVVDFFAGSASLAHAVLEQNAEDGGNRRFIAVQLPQPLPIAEPTLKTIADIGQERIRQVIRKAHRGGGDITHSGTNGNSPVGFRVFKQAPSNFRSWITPASDPTEYADQMALFVDPLLPGFAPENVIWEVALKEGFGLNSHIEAVQAAAANVVHRVSDPDKSQAFLICLDERITPDLPRALGLTKDDLFICRDIALDDEQAANLALQCRLKTI